MKVRVVFDIERSLDIKIRQAAKGETLTRAAWLRRLVLSHFAEKNNTKPNEH